MAAFLVLIFFPAIMSLGFMIAYMMIKAFRPGQVNSILSAKGGWLYFAMLLLPAGLVCWQTFRTSTWQDTGFRLPDLMGLHEGFTVFFATIAAVILGYLLYFNELFLTYQVTQRIRSVNKTARRAVEGASSTFTENPVNHREFFALSVGIACLEEWLWRGFFIFFLMNGFQMSAWLALLISSVSFGINHAYYGLRNLLLKTLDGLVWGSVFVLTASLWIPVLSHLSFQYFVWRRLQRQIARQKVEGMEVGK